MINSLVTIEEFNERLIQNKIEESLKEAFDELDQANIEYEIEFVNAEDE